MKVSDYIAKFLATNCVTHVFELSGGMITHMLDSIYNEGKIEIITMHHEQSASFAADAFGRIRKVPGVAFATSGPGATNLITGIGSCYFDSSPAVFITGQVNIHEQKGNKKIRQLGFQETEIVEMVKPITKAVFKVDDANLIPTIMHQAFEIAMEGRPGPVLIDIPMNIQRVDIEDKVIDNVKNSMKVNSTLLSSILTQLLLDIGNSKSPLILVGRGVVSSSSERLLLDFAELYDIPIITTLLGLDVVPFNHRLRVGFIGSYGNRWANLAIGDCDLMIVIGSRLDIRQTGADVDGFQKNKKIYHIDCDENEINNRLSNCISIVSDAKAFLKSILDFDFKAIQNQSKKEWIDQIAVLKKRWQDTDEIIGIEGINPNRFIHELSHYSKEAACILADVGSHQMWAAQSLEIQSQQKFLTSGGMGSMGFALPAAIGACFACERKPIVTIIGDGCFQLNIQELQTIVRNKLPIKIVVMNNKSLGMIRQFQDSYFDSRHQSTVWGYDTPDFELVSKAYGIDAMTITEEAEFDKGLEEMWRHPNQAFLLQVMINKNANAYPKIAFGKPITEMEPHSKPLDMEGT